MNLFAGNIPVTTDSLIIPSEHSPVAKLQAWLTQLPVEFSEIISGLPKPERERHFAALIDYPDEPLSRIKIQAKRSKYKTVIKIHLPETYARALNRASADSEQDPEAIALKAVMEWLDRAGYVK